MKNEIVLKEQFGFCYVPLISGFSISPISLFILRSVPVDISFSDPASLSYRNPSLQHNLSMVFLIISLA